MYITEKREGEGNVSRCLPLSRAKMLRLNSFARIIGVNVKSAPYSAAVSLNASLLYLTMGAAPYKGLPSALAMSKSLSGL